MGGYNIASLADREVEEASSVDISVEENIEELEIMEKAGHQLLNDDGDMTGTEIQTNTVTGDSASGTEKASR